MKKLHEYNERNVIELFYSEGWDRPLKPVRQVKPSGWLSVAFWMLRVYVLLMLAVVTFAFVRGIH